MPRRPGVTLTEVLVAIFIMAIGLLTLLTLFPLGAISMKQALQDSQAGNVAANAAAIAEAKRIRQDQLVAYDQDPLAPNGQRDVFKEPEPRRKNGPPKFLPAVSDGPSYPVYVDPLGWLTETSAHQVGDKRDKPNWYGIPRRNLYWVYWKGATTPNTPSDQARLASRFFTTQDDLNFQKDGSEAGTPNYQTIGTARQVERQGRHSRAYLLRRPRASDPSVVDLSVVVYLNRSAVLVGNEPVFEGITFNPGANTITVPYSGARPDIAKGAWVLDATMTLGSGPNVMAEPHGFFYRVIGVTDDGHSLTLETQDPIRGRNPRPGGTAADEKAPYQGTLIYLDGVVEVFDKGSGWQP